MKKLKCEKCNRVRWAKTTPAPFKGFEHKEPKEKFCKPCQKKFPKRG